MCFSSLGTWPVAVLAGLQGVQGVGGKDGQGGGRGELSWCLWGGSNISAMTIRQGLERGLWAVPGHLLENSAEEWPRTRL